ncbi:TPA: amidohydrolase [Klebsiella quasipneumoniae subsp. quasipneumoniae]|nr:amidohydrolase [Klebsiella quasipneumoniae]
MEPIFQFVDEVIEASRETYCAIADDIWDHPETRFEEFWSARRLADALEAEGFQLTRDAGGIPNAFIASVGEGQPVIALLGEFDALAGLSQQAHCAEPTSSTPGGNGHGCGHNLLGTAAFAAAVAAKKWLQQHGGAGTLRFYGCPGEEGGSGKTFMVREGLFDDVDAALTWHPEAWAGMFSTRTLANIQAAWRFTGTAAHAANSPHLGRSALDAVTLMTTGSNFLNEHIIEKARVHYAITDTGGVSPNVVQAQAEVLYLIRAPEMADVEQIFARIEKIAQGAALMTETHVSWKAPVAQCFSPCFAVGTPLHSWQLVSQGRTAIAHKGMLLAGKVLAATAIRLFSDRALLEASQRELRQALAEHPYRCPIPTEVRPSVLR